MKTIELLEKYPETAKLIQKHLFSKLMDSLKDTPQDMPEEFKARIRHTEISMDKIAVFITHNARQLFDFFDGYEIYVETLRYDDKFVCRVEGKSIPPYDDRIIAEEEAIRKCFPILEEKLLTIKNKEQDG